MSEISKGILNSFIMESAAPAAGTKMTAAMEAVDDTDAAEDDDLFDDAENDDSLDEEDVFIAEIDGDDDPCEEEDDFYDSVIESIEAESFGDSALEAVTESAEEVDEEAEYEQVLEDAVYALKQMPEDEIVKVLESLSPDTIQDLIAMEEAIDTVALVMEDCDDDDCDDEECEDCDEDEDDKPKKKDDKKRKDKKDDEDEDDDGDAEDDKINTSIKVNSFSTVLNPVGTFENETADDYLDLFDDDDDDYDDL